MPDKDALRLLSLAAILCVATAHIVVAFFFGHQFIPDIDRLQASGEWLMVLVSYIAVPLFIAFRVFTAPAGSAIFPIGLLTSLAIGVLLYVYIVSGDSYQNNFLLFLAILVFWLGAFFCLIPKWSDHH